MLKKTTINEDSEKYTTNIFYNLEEFIKDIQEKIPIVLEIEQKYDWILRDFFSFSMGFIIDTYKLAKKLKEV